MKLLIYLGLVFMMLGTSYALTGNEAGLDYWYEFQGNTSDSSPNNNDGTDTGTSNITGKYNDARSFDGKTSYVIPPTDHKIALSRNSSFFAWIKVNDNSTSQYIYGRKTTHERFFFYVYNERINFQARKSSDPADIHNSSLKVKTGKWYHVGFTITQKTINLYMNGTLQDTWTIPNTITTADLTYIGARNNADAGTVDTYFNGTIDEVSKWTKPLTPTEVTNMYLYNSLNATSSVNRNFTFNDTDNDQLITNLSFGSYYLENDTKLEIDLTQLGNGYHTLTFSKPGYEAQNVTFFVNLSAAQPELLTNVSTAKIQMSIYNRETLAKVTGTSQINIVATQGFEGNTTTGEINITNESFVNEDYIAIIEHSGYNTETVYFSFTNNKSINVSAYLLNSTISTSLKIIVRDNNNFFVSDATVRALEWIPSLSQYQTVTEGKSNSIGEININIEKNNKLYIFTASKNSITSSIGPEIITLDNEERTIILADSITNVTPYLNGFESSFTDSITGNLSTLSFFFQDNNNQITQGCIQINKISGSSRILLSENCLNGTSGIVMKSIYINETYSIEAKAIVRQNTNIFSIDSIIYPYSQSFSEIEWYGLNYLLIFVLFIASISTIFLFENVYIMPIGFIISTWTAFFLIPGIFDGKTAVTISLFCLLGVWGGFKAK